MTPPSSQVHVRVGRSPQLQPMRDRDKTKEQLVQELVSLRQEVGTLQDQLRVTQADWESRWHKTEAELKAEVEARTAALKESNDQFVAEIAERYQVLHALRTAKDQLEAILAAVPGTVSWISDDLHYLGVNQHLARTFNLNPEDFIGKELGFLGSSQGFDRFVQDFFISDAQEAFREVSIQMHGKTHIFLIVAQKYDNNRAAFTVGIDITERKEAEEALREAENKYRAIFENAVEGIFQMEPDGRYISANPALARIYGYASSEALKTAEINVREQLYINAEQRQKFSDLLHQHDFVVGFESQLQRLDGQLTWISENARAVRDEQGNLLYYEGTVEDITERKLAEEKLWRLNEELEQRVERRTAELKQAVDRLTVEISERQRAEAALRVSEAELRALFAAMTDIITVFDAEGRFIKVVSTNSETLFSPTTDRIGKTVYDVLPPEQADLFVRQIQKVIETGQTANLEYSLPMAAINGTLPSDTVENSPGDFQEPGEIWFAATVSPMPDNCAIWVARNVTERKRVVDAMRAAEEKYRSIFENAAEGIFQITPEGRYLSANPALARMYGYGNPEELMEQLTNVGDNLYVDPHRREMFMSAIARENAVSNFESQVYRQDRSIIWTSENARAVRDEQSNLLFCEGTVEDITKRKQAEAALRAEQQKSEQLLLNILPGAIAQRLKQEQHAIADRFDEVTILFADIVNFTRLSSGISATELVSLLNEIFSAFDQLAQVHGVEKIKTIGDSYMVVSGIPTPRDDHAEAIAQMALDMQQEILKFRQPNGQQLKLRIGISTGPVVAGVIGVAKFIYDLWGDAVNVASRMESLGIPGKIQVTEATYQQLKHRYAFEKRGEIEVKGKGAMTTYWLIGSSEPDNGAIVEVEPSNPE
ncbi:adenylate/guanylate cyclase domain-containing protein [Roseofilum casamattae]|uniref:Adenylate/guanylate cyclase domain-containing protein n=1 Tax=Roseofilum casamattae BLCC-M143 TaxID=3022442 RepID=A0ABT7BTD1_9CYAN|nr:adenylate/guanylate cyclase domain-containing protein [Roseofilum casamattae]MDJ1182442.1 adenylate/guanylate cyclase domain-containing protein [Roseofilum casamattae BLCC-M143]